MTREPGFIVSIDDERRELFALADGVITLDAIRAHLDQERTAGALAYRELIDARGATPELSPADLRELIALLRGDALFARHGPTAVVVGTEDAFALVRTLSLVLADVVTLRVFRDFAEAADWLAAMPVPTRDPLRPPPTWH